MRALLIEDAPCASNNIASMLRDAGLQVDEIRSDEDPAGLARHFEFDVIFLHLRSPTGSFAALRLLRAAAIQAPVLVLSGPAPLQTKCVFRRIPAADSEANQPVIPAEASH
jgi:DNA-binding response OmpR family regulator